MAARRLIAALAFGLVTSTCTFYFEDVEGFPPQAEITLPGEGFCQLDVDAWKPLVPVGQPEKLCLQTCAEHGFALSFDASGSVGLESARWSFATDLPSGSVGILPGPSSTEVAPTITLDFKVCDVPGELAKVASAEGAKIEVDSTTGTVTVSGVKRHVTVDLYINGMPDGYEGLLHQRKILELNLALPEDESGAVTDCDHANESCELTD